MEVPQQLSREAVEEFGNIYEDEFGEKLSDAQVNEMALRVLRLFDVMLELDDFRSLR